MGNISITHWMFGRVGPRADLDAVGKTRISFTSREANYYSFVIKRIT
jgi:hypothetical protein